MASDFPQDEHRNNGNVGERTELKVKGEDQYTPVELTAALEKHFDMLTEHTENNDVAHLESAFRYYRRIELSPGYGVYCQIIHNIRANNWFTWFMIKNLQFFAAKLNIPFKPFMGCVEDADKPAIWSLYQWVIKVYLEVEFDAALIISIVFDRSIQDPFEQGYEFLPLYARIEMLLWLVIFS